MLSIIDTLTIVCILAFFIVYVFLLRKLNKPIMFVLGLALFCVTYSQIILLLHSFPIFKKIVFLTYSDAFIYYLCAPLLYMFFLNITKKRSFISPLNGLNLLPMLPGFIYWLYYNRLSTQEQQYYSTVKACGILPDNLLYIIGGASQFLYVILSIIILQRYLKRNESILSFCFIKQLQLYTWIMYTLFFLALGLDMLALIVDSPDDVRQVAKLCLLIQFTAIFIIAFLHNKMCKQAPVNPHDIEKANSNAINPEFAELAKRIEDIIHQKLLYKNPNLDLALLSKETNIPAYKISTCLNTIFDLSFPEYINKQRIKYAQKKIEDSKNLFIKMDFLAYECGFNSRSNFYKQFKKYSGITPTEFQKQLSQNNSNSSVL